MLHIVALILVSLAGVGSALLFVMLFKAWEKQQHIIGRVLEDSNRYMLSTQDELWRLTFLRRVRIERLLFRSEQDLIREYETYVLWHIEKALK